MLFAGAVLLFLLGIKNTLKHDSATAKKRPMNNGIKLTNLNETYLTYLIIIN